MEKRREEDIKVVKTKEEVEDFWDSKYTEYIETVKDTRYQAQTLGLGKHIIVRMFIKIRVEIVEELYLVMSFIFHLSFY